MTTNEPTEIGTIVQRPDGKRYAVLLEPGGEAWRVYLVSGADAPGAFFHLWASWEDIEDWNLVHRGWTPPTPEPTGKGAVVLSATGYIMHAIDDPIVGQRQWQYADGSGRLFWGQLAQPARELFAGVSE